MVVRKGWCIRLIKLFCPWTSVCPWAIAMMNTQKKYNTSKKEIQYERHK